MTEQDRLSRNNRKLTELNAWLRPKALAILRMMLAASARAHGLETGIRFGLSAANRAAAGGSRPRGNGPRVGMVG